MASLRDFIKDSLALPDWLPVRHYGGYYKKATASSASRHPMILSDAGNWSIECSCGGI
jgi:hypothetical protein